LALDGVIPFDLGIPARVFSEALDSDGRALYSVRTCSLGGRVVTSNNDIGIVVGHDETLLQQVDTVVIATQEPTPEMLEAAELAADIAAALVRIPAKTRIVSLCTSAFVLAAAGMLDGHRATTHWGLCSRLARLFPQVSVDPDVLFVDNGRVLTSAGGAAGIDLCLHLVRRDFGADIAAAAARRCVVAPWRDGGQAQFIEHPMPIDSGNSTADTRGWALSHLDSSLSVPDLARHARMSVRTFTRRFRAEVGQSPTQWIIQRRVDHTRRLLESTDLTVDQIASAVGFASATLLRKHLRSSVGLSPGAYRRTFAAPSPNTCWTG
jgi:transcriptional regulator GlxA family with amidase domain